MQKSQYMENKRNGNIAEVKFRDWLDRNGIPYLCIRQDKRTFSRKLKDNSAKRPDFFVFMNNDLIIVDVKHRNSIKEHRKCTINIKETIKYKKLSEIINLKSYYVVSNDEYGYEKWFWIPVASVIENHWEFKQKSEYNYNYSIPMEKFERVSDKPSLEEAFKKFLEIN